MISGDTQRILDRLAAQECQLAAQGRELARLRRRRRWWRLPLAGLVLVALALAPLGVLGASFGDLNPGSPHNNDINLIADAGISRGCGSTATYCPNDLVTREQMASFLARTAGLGGNPPVANALTAVYAGDATTLNGWTANSLVRTNVGANTSGAGVNLTGGYQTIAFTGMEIPGPGLVYVTGATSVTVGGNGLSSVVSARLRDTASGATSPALYQQSGYSGGMSAFASLSPTWVFQVTSGGDRYFSIDGRIEVGSGNPNMGNATISILYVPFGPGGVQAASLEEAGGDTWPGPITIP